MKCVIIDDDPGCVETMVQIVKNRGEDIKIVGTALSVEAGIKVVESQNPDIVFLDVEVGDQLGFELLHAFPKPSFEIVFTTAYEKYALQAIKSSCYDYLLKPIISVEFDSVVSRLINDPYKKQQEHVQILLSSMENMERNNQKIAIPTVHGYSFIDISQLLLLEGDGKYSRLTTFSGQQYTSTKNLGEFESILPDDTFYRCHKSWVVNLRYVDRFDKSSNKLFMQGNRVAEVSSRKRDEFMKLFGRA
jgi:two-component system LytT family response regulator